MRKLLYSILILAVAASCDKNIEEQNDFESLQPAKTDLDAGTWKPVLLTAPDEFAVAEPAATNTPAYIAEVNEIKSWQKNITEAQKAAIKYWSAGAVLRWNEILRELV